MTGRYARLDQIPWWNRRLVSEGRALVAGAGALGNEVAKNLALAGWGTVVVVDSDVVEASNLTRSVMFTAADVGRPKSEVVAAAMRRVNPDVHVVPVHGDLRLAVGSGLVSRVDVVLGCLDNLEARIALAQLVTRVGRFYVDGALAVWEGSVRVYEGRSGPCYGCGLTEEDLREVSLRRSCLAYAARAEQSGGVPTTPPLASVTAGFWVQQALRRLHADDPSMPPAAVGREIRWDGGHDRLWSTALPVNPGCHVHTAAVEDLPALRHAVDDTWARLWARARDVAGPGTTVYLPVGVLHGWECPACGEAADVEPVAQVGEGSTPCTSCGRPAAARRAFQLDGAEPWAEVTPLRTGFPALAWLDAVGPEGSVVIELAAAAGTADAGDAADAGALTGWGES